MPRVVRFLCDAVLAVAVAPLCASCGRPLDTAMASAACRACWSAIHPLRPPLCASCGDPLPTWRGTAAASHCAACRADPPLVSLGRAAGEYDGPLRRLLHALKYEGRRSLAGPLAALMRERGAEALDGADLAVPVPLHWTRAWARGFNQAHLLAAELGLPVAAALRRRRRTPTQTGMDAHARAANVAGAFAVRRPRDIAGRSIVLVDDVRTTGATAEACAAALLESGAREVRCLTAARVATRLPAARPR